MDALYEGVMESEVAMAATQTMNREINRTFPDSEQMDSKLLHPGRSIGSIINQLQPRASWIP